MKSLQRVAFTSLVVLLWCSSLWAQSPQQLFQQALSKERAEGKLEEAIELYQRVVKEAGSDRSLASRALLQLGRCYERLGTEGARAAYERLVREYGDQTRVVAEAKSRLAALTRDTAAPPVPIRMSIRELPNVALGNDIHSISPDGTKALFGDYTRGQNIGIYDFTTNTSRLLTTFDWKGAWVSSGRWSPDGRQVAYMQASWKAGAVAEVRVSNLAGETRTIFPHETMPGGGAVPIDWLPDGKSILVMLQQPNALPTIGTLSVAEGTFTPLRSLPWEWTDPPRLSPDGRFVAFVQKDSGVGDIHVMTIDGKETFRVTDHAADDRQGVWSPDGHHLAFISNRLGGDALWVVRMKGGEPAGEPVKLKDGMQGTRLIEWSSRGITAVQFIRTWDIYTLPMNPEGLRAAGTPQPIPYARRSANFSPVWSNDGKYLAFISATQREGSSRHVVILPAAGGHAREFLIPTTYHPWPASPADLRWFGNGKGLGFTGYDADRNQVVFRLTLDSGEWNTYSVPVKAWTRVAWNEAGSEFYFSRQSFAEPNGGIFALSVDGGEERRMYALEQPGSLQSLEVSPDGAWLAFRQFTLASGETGTIDVMALNLSSGEVKTVAGLTTSLTPDAATLDLAGWVDDGLLIQQQPARESVAQRYVAPLDGGERRSLNVDIQAPGGASELDRAAPLARWSPDKTSMVFVRTSSTGGAFVVENPLAEVASSTTKAAAH
jgi:Tol biopolymer transport system component